MKAYLTTIGEKTTDICKSQLKRFGYDVVLMDKKIQWIDKYLEFIDIAKEDCIRIDGDVIPNKNIEQIPKLSKGKLFVTFIGYDFYRNDTGCTSPVYYSKEVLKFLKNNKDKINSARPEASALRIPEINKDAYKINLIIGMHGFFQDKETFERGIQNKRSRGQEKDYDLELALKIFNL